MVFITLAYVFWKGISRKPIIGLSKKNSKLVEIISEAQIMQMIEEFKEKERGYARKIAELFSERDKLNLEVTFNRSIDLIKSLKIWKKDVKIITFILLEWKRKTWC